LSVKEAGSGQMTKFYEIEPTLENYWRAIILFGRNTASYKFALAKALYELHASGKTLITLDELAIPYANHLCERLKTHPRQGTSNKSTFLDHLRAFNEKAISYEEMISQTIRYGFNNVIDAFHNVHGQEVGTRFFIDERKNRGGIQQYPRQFTVAQALTSG
jgi:hypothetical protein